MTNQNEPQASESAMQTPCPVCSGRMQAKVGRNGTYLGCTNYPECEGTLDVDDNGDVVAQPDRRILISEDLDVDDNGDVVAQPNRRILISEEKVSRFSRKKLAIGLAAAFGVLVGVVALLYVITTPLSPVLAAEEYIEGHYDAVAEDVVEFVFQEHSLKTELLAEVGESIAEQVVPYSCVAALGWEMNGASCALTFRTDQPMTVELGVPVVVKLRPVSGLFGQQGAVAYDSSIVYDGLAVNIPALEQLEKVGEVASVVEDVATGVSEGVSQDAADVAEGVADAAGELESALDQIPGFGN